jgi:chemotaxis protein MotB
MVRTVNQNNPNQEKGHHCQTTWLTTFNDMITLLMVFFVLLFSMSSLDVQHFNNFQDALQSAMGVLHPGQHAPDGIISEQGHNASLPADTAQGKETDQQLTPLHDTHGLEAQYTPKGIHLTLNDNLLFTSGSARLTSEGRTVLDKVVNIIGPLGRHIRVEGHTDDIPIATAQYPSNWELSIARAISVVKYMQNTGAVPSQRLSAAGYGASKPRAVNDSKKNRAKNRRVEIILQQRAASYSGK